MKILKRLLFLSLASLLLFGVVGWTWNQKALAAYRPNYLMKDSIFLDKNSMGVNAIQNFLISMGGGIYKYADYEYCGPTTGAHYAYYVSYFHCDTGPSSDRRTSTKKLAAQIIYDTSQAYGINPRVTMSTLQKEQSLITDPAPSSGQLDCAMGYNSCSGYSGFFNQVDNGVWQLRENYEGAAQNASWGDGWSANSVYLCGASRTQYTPGLYPGNDVTFRNDSGVAYTHFTIANATTASLYCYTPYVGPYSQTGYSGSYNFITFYEAHWGSATSICLTDSNISGTRSGRQILALNSPSGRDNLAFTILNNTGSTCAENHIFGSGFGSWSAHYSTAMPPADPSTGIMVGGNIYGKTRNQVSFIRYSGSEGRAELHILSADYQGWLLQRLSDLSGISSSTGTFVAGDFLGRGYDQLAYISYYSRSGNMEIHLFDSGLHKAIGFHDVTTNISSSTASNSTFVAGDFLGRGYDQLALVPQGSTSVHLLDVRPGAAIRLYEKDTPGISNSSSTGTFVAGDFLGRGYDQLLYVIYSGASGKVETHMFSRDFTKVTGVQDLATILDGFGAPL